MQFGKDMAMFRYSVISRLLHGEEERSLKSRMQELAERIWTLPDGCTRRFSWGTIEEWYYAYRSSGIDGLTKNPRKDRGGFRMMTNDVSSYIDRYVKEHPKIKTSVMIEQMLSNTSFRDNMPSCSTVYRYVRSIKPEIDRPLKERRAFEAPYSGSLWQTDIMYGPYLPYVNDRGRNIKKQTYLVAVIDDHSRLLCNGQFYFSQDILAYLDCLKTALNKYGIPEKLYCDNGQVFLSHQVKDIMAALGTTVIHAQVSDAAAKGKIERFFRTVRDSFLNPLIEFKPPAKLEELNREFRKWCESSYNHKVHSTISERPIDRWMRTSHKLRLMKVGGDDEIFRFTATRKVKKDGTFSLKNKIFETTYALANKTVTVKYDPFFPERPYVSFEGATYGRANLLNRDFNCTAPRKRNNKDAIK